MRQMRVRAADGLQAEVVDTGFGIVGFGVLFGFWFGFFSEEYLEGLVGEATAVFEIAHRDEFPCRVGRQPLFAFLQEFSTSCSPTQ